MNSLQATIFSVLGLFLLQFNPSEAHATTESPESTAAATSAVEGGGTTTDEPVTQNNYQLCFTLKELDIYNIDYHSRKSSYAGPKGQVHLFDPSLTHPSIRSFDIPLKVSSDPNITSYTYKDLNIKLCWINTKSTQLYFDFDIFQFYHMAMRVGSLLNTGLNGSGLERKNFKIKNTMNLTSSHTNEYSDVIVSIYYEFELKILTKKEYDSLKAGTQTIEGSQTELDGINALNEINAIKGNEIEIETEKNEEFNELYDDDLTATGRNERGNNVSNGSGSSSNTGMVIAAIIAAIVGFGVLVAVGIYMIRMYSRKDYIDVDKNKKGTNGKFEFYEEVKDGIKGRLRRINLKDTKEKFGKIKEKAKGSISMAKNVETYDTISDPKIKTSSKVKDTGSEDDASIDVSIITNESRGLP